MKGKVMVGGQAVIEGVMMMSPKKYSIAVRNPKGKIVTKTTKLKLKKGFPFETPFLRGIFRFIDMIVIGIKSINYSANASSEEEEQLTKKDLIFTLLFSILINLALFIAVPLLITNLIAKRSDTIVFNLIDGVLRLVIFLIFLIVITLLKDIRRLFQYHGAEHMTVHCYEAKKKLTIQNVKKFSRLHPRCGTTFLLIVFCLSILVFSVIPRSSLFIRFFLRLLLIPLIAGISYEILKFSAAHINNPIMKVIIFPGLMLQNLTTRIPNGSQIETAIVALKKALS